MIVGNDISLFQSVDWNTYRNNTNFVIIKATEGVGFTDPRFFANLTASRDNALLRGFYHFARPDLGNSAIDEANYFLSTIGSLQNGEILALDYEVTYSDPVTWCKAFLDQIYTQCGVRPLIYLNQATCASYDWTPVIDASYGLWIAAYTYDPAKNDFNGGKWQTSVMQQWTDKQQVPGISGNTDGDVFFGDFNTFLSYGYKTPAVIIPPPVGNPCADYKNQVDTLTQKVTDLTKELAVSVDRVTSLVMQNANLQTNYDDYRALHTGTQTYKVPNNPQTTNSSDTNTPPSTSTVITNPNLDGTTTNSVNSIPGANIFSIFIHWFLGK